MSEKVTAETAKEAQVLAPVIGDIVTVIHCETEVEVEIQLTDVYKYGQGFQVAGDVIREQKYTDRYGKERTIEVGDYFEAMSAYGKYWAIYEPHGISGNDSKPIRTLFGHEELVVISKEEGIIDYQRTR
jgi:hypothetical protein